MREKMKRSRERARVGKFGSFQRKTAESATVQPPNSICPTVLRETPQQGGFGGGGVGEEEEMKQKQRTAGREGGRGRCR